MKILEDSEGEALDVGRKTRTIAPSLRRALKSRDQGCVFPGLDDGAWRFVKRNGESLRACVPGRTASLGDWTALVAAHAASGIGIDEQTAATRWRGERMDNGLAIDLLLSKLQGATRAQVGGALL